MITIYHNPNCETSRNVLAHIRKAGIEPTIIEYLKHPPTRAGLVSLLKRMGLSARALMREKGTPAAELGLTDPARSDEEIIEAMVANPILINRPIVATPRAVKLCRPSQTVLDILTE